MKKFISPIIFWGALWGLEEATLGHLLHITGFSIGWFFWFPLAYFFMGMVYRQTGKLNSIMFTSIIAASIKFINIFMTANLVIIVCPALSILLEGISVITVIKLICLKEDMQKYKFTSIISISLLWRILFLASLIFIPSWIMPSYPYKSVSSILKLFFYEGILNSLVIYAVIALVKRTNEIPENKDTFFKQLKDKISGSTRVMELCFKPIFSLTILVVTLLIQWVLQVL